MPPFLGASKFLWAVHAECQVADEIAILTTINTGQWLHDMWFYTVVEKLSLKYHPSQAFSLQFKVV